MVESAPVTYMIEGLAKMGPHNIISVTADIK